MRITAAQNVGIGTTNPSARLTVGRVDSSNEGGQIDLCRASDNASAWAVDVFGNTSTPSFRIVDNIAAASRMVIDSAGRVTTPFQPAFRVFHNNTLAWNSGALSPIVYNTAVFNVGNHYNTSTGVFTAPIAGVYSFTVYEMFMDEPSYTFIYLAVQINGVTTSEFMRQGTKSNFDTFGGTVLVSLSANDQVRIVCGLNGVDAGYLRLGVDMNSFMGYLIG